MKNFKKIIFPLIIIVAVVFLAGCSKTAETVSKPIEGFNEFWDIFVFPMAGLMWVIGKTAAFGNYPLTIIIATIVVRTLAWPIYAKTNDMQLKMGIAQPEIDKIQAKYQGRDDQESKQRMSMETMQIYKKYGIGVMGCLTPLIQMPIFIGFYRTIARIPASIYTEGNWIGKIFNSTKIFGVDMLLKQNETAPGLADGGWGIQRWGVIILAVLVGATQILSVILSNIRQKKLKESQASTVPAYRRQAQSDQQKTTAKTMQIMMYFMSAMMVVLVWTSAAGLGLYWLIGNVYSTLQTWLGQRSGSKRTEKLKEKHSK